MFLLWYLSKETEGTCLQALILVGHLFPFACLHIIGTSIEHLGSDACHILTVLVINICCFFRNLASQGATEELCGVLGDVLLGIFFRVPSHIHKQLDRILHRFQVAHIQDPHALDAMIIGQRELFEHLLCLSDVEPLCITRRTNIVYVIIDAPSSLMGTFLCVNRHTTYIAPVVVTYEHDDIIGHTETCIVIVLHLFI